MRLLALVVVACGTSTPPPLGDPDGAMMKPLYEGGIVTPAPVDAGGDGATNAFYTDYESLCPTGYQPIWRYHDFMTKTPGGSSIAFSAQTAAAVSDFTTAPAVQLGKVTGPDITVWTGIDVDPKLATIGQKSLHYLRVTTTFQMGEAGAPTLVNVRQQVDCVATQ